MRATLSFFLLVVTLSTAAASFATIPVPTGQEFYDVPPSEHPIVVDALSGSSPVGVGSVARGGSDLNVQIGLGEFEGPVDIFIALHLPNMNPPALYFVAPDSSLVAFSGDFTVWRSNTVGPVNASLWGAISTSNLPSMRIDVYVIVAPTESAAAGSQSLRTAQRRAPQRFILIRSPMLILSKTDAWTLKIDIDAQASAPPSVIHYTNKARILFYAYLGVDKVYYIDGFGSGIAHVDTAINECTASHDGETSAYVTGLVTNNCSEGGICRPSLWFTGLAETTDWKPGILSCPGIDFPLEFPVIQQPALMPPNVYMPFENGATTRVPVDVGPGHSVTYYLTILKGVVQ